jgi:hypothetical protein
MLLVVEFRYCCLLLACSAYRWRVIIFLLWFFANDVCSRCTLICDLCYVRMPDADGWRFRNRNQTVHAYVNSPTEVICHRAGTVLYTIKQVLSVSAAESNRFCRCFAQPQHALTVILITCTNVNIADPLQPPTVPKTNGPIYSRFLIPTSLFYTLDQGSQKWLPLPSAHLGRIKRRRFPSFSAILFNHDNVLH